MVARLQGDTRGHAHLPYASSRWSQSAAVRSATATAFSARGARILMSQLGRVTTSMPLNPHTMSMSSCPARTRVGLRRAFWRPSRRARAKTLAASSNLKPTRKERKKAPFCYPNAFTPWVAFCRYNSTNIPLHEASPYTKSIPQGGWLRSRLAQTSAPRGCREQSVSADAHADAPVSTYMYCTTLHGPVDRQSRPTYSTRPTACILIPY